jgi:hypothetical protein
MALLFFGTKTKFLSWISFVNLNPTDAASGYCIFPISPLDKLLAGLYLPFVSLAFMWLTFVLRKLTVWCLPKCCKQVVEAPASPSSPSSPSADVSSVDAPRVSTTTAFTNNNNSSGGGKPSCPQRLYELARGSSDGGALYNKYIRASVAVFLLSCKFSCSFASFFFFVV